MEFMESLSSNQLQEDGCEQHGQPQQHDRFLIRWIIGRSRSISTILDHYGWFCVQSMRHVLAPDKREQERSRDGADQCDYDQGPNNSLGAKVPQETIDCPWDSNGQAG